MLHVYIVVFSVLREIDGVTCLICSAICENVGTNDCCGGTARLGTFGRKLILKPQKHNPIAAPNILFRTCCIFKQNLAITDVKPSLKTSVNISKFCDHCSTFISERVTKPAFNNKKSNQFNSTFNFTFKFLVLMHVLIPRLSTHAQPSSL